MEEAAARGAVEVAARAVAAVRVAVAVRARAADGGELSAPAGNAFARRAERPFPISAANRATIPNARNAAR